MQTNKQKVGLNVKTKKFKNKFKETIFQQSFTLNIINESINE